MTRLAAILLFLGGCDVEVSLGSHDAAILTDAGTDAATFADAGLDATPPNDAGVDSAQPADAGSDAASAADIGTESPPPTCATPDAGVCVQCEATMCCAEYTACAAATTCPCIVDCVLHGHTAASCATHCGPDHGESGPLVTCAQHSCTCP